MSWLIKIGQFIAAYSLLYYRPEFFILVSKAMNKSALETFLIVWFWTTFLTVLTYWAPDLIKRIFRKLFKKSRAETKSPFYVNWFIIAWFKSLNQKFKNLSNKTVKKIINYSPYLLFLTFTFPIIPGLDTASVIAARLLKVRWAFPIFILINTIKFLIITALCYQWFR